MYKPYLKRRSYKRPKEVQFIGSFDIETYDTSHKDNIISGLGGDFNTGGVMWEEAPNAWTRYHTAKEMLLFMVEHPRTYFAHNAGRFDFLYLHDDLVELVEQGYTVEYVSQGTTPIGIIITHESKKGYKCVLRDSLPLFSMPLKDVAKAYTTLSKGDIGLSEGEVYDDNNDTHRQYLYHDLYILLVAYRSLEQKNWELFNSPLGWTTGSTGIKALKANLPEGKSYPRPCAKVDTFIRKTYHGGYNFMGTTIEKQHDFVSVDRSAAYAHQMLQKVGTDVPIYTNFYMGKGTLAFYKVHVLSVPDIKAPVLYDCRGEGVPPLYNDFISYCTSIELEYALEVGYQVEVIEGYYHERLECPFENLIKICERYEGEKPEYKPCVKNTRNSTYGKFGSKILQERLVMSLVEPENCKVVCDETTGITIPNLYSVTEVSEEDYMIVGWASIITARQRVDMIRLINTCYEIGATTVYCDTDSLFTNRHIINQLFESGIIFSVPGVQYGSWKIEKELETFQTCATKNYVGMGYIGEVKKTYQRSKGTPLKRLKDNDYLETKDGEKIKVKLTQEEHEKAMSGDEKVTIKYLSLTSYPAYMKKQGAMRQIRKRSVSHVSRAPGWQLEGSSVSPLKIKRYA